MGLRPGGPRPRRGKAPVLHRDRFAGVVGVLGPARTGELFARLGGQIEDLLAARPPGEAPDALIALIHQLRGSAATLGMDALGTELERWELALARGTDGTAEAAKVRLALAAAAQAATSALAGAARPHADGRASR
jgi:hypothetical protein